MKVGLQVRGLLVVARQRLVSVVWDSFFKCLEVEQAEQRIAAANVSIEKA